MALIVSKVLFFRF